MVPKRLIELRKKRKYSQEYLGVATGIDEETAKSRISHYELGLNKPNFALMQRISHVFNVPVCYFYTPEDDLAEFILSFYGDKNGIKPKF